ncbi:MAG: NuoM family protein [Alphaproteobacteria bacterium]
MILESIPILSLIIFLPVLGSFFISMVDKSVSSMNTRYVGLWVTGVVFFINLLLACLFSFETEGFQFIDRLSISENIKLDYMVGVDVLSLPFVLLTTFIFPLSIIASWDKEVKNLKFFISLLLILETLILGAFCSLNLLSFYIFFESVLVPICFLAGMNNVENKINVAFRSILYTLVGSVFLLVSLLKIFEVTGTFSFIDISQKTFSFDLEIWLFLGFLASFITKVPVVPFHTWLPNAYAESSSTISMIVSGTALKLSVYGLLRFLPFLFPKALIFFAPWLQGWFMVSFIYTAVAGYTQQYVRRFLGYLSISQISLGLAAVFSLKHVAIAGGMINVFIHGLVFPSAFYVTGLLYSRLNTDRIKFYGGIGQVMPQFSIAFFIMCLGLMGIPGTPYFIGNFLIIGTLAQNINVGQGAIVALGLFVYAICLIWLYRRVVFGVITEAMIRGISDLNMREKSLTVGLLLVMVILGVCPQIPLNFSNTFSSKIIQHLEREKDES